MQYRTGMAGRIIIVRFEDGEDILRGLRKISQKEDIKAGIFYIIGGMRDGEIVVGPKEDKIPPEPVWRRLGGSHEVIGMGTIFWEGDEPRIHLHGAFGKGDAVRVGCLRRGSETFLVIEAIIIEIKGVKAVRELDPASGMTLLKLH
jgi:predicted DNA-binding protein with PD1-like motif